MILVYGPSSFYEAFRRNKEENFFKALAYIDPNFEAIVREKTKTQKLEFHSVVNLPSFIRKHSPKIPLIGDAACFKDQCTASGMTHALRDSTLLADCLELVNQGELTLSLALDKIREFALPGLTPLFLILQLSKLK